MRTVLRPPLLTQNVIQRTYNVSRVLSDLSVIACHTQDNEIIRSQTVVKLLGVYIDVLLKFDHHVSYMCSRASNKVNALARLSESK